jgi:hypothetical protein
MAFNQCPFALQAAAFTRNQQLLANVKMACDAFETRSAQHTAPAFLLFDQDGSVLDVCLVCNSDLVSDKIKGAGRGLKDGQVVVTHRPWARATGAVGIELQAPSAFQACSEAAGHAFEAIGFNVVLAYGADVFIWLGDLRLDWGRARGFGGLLMRGGRFLVAG